MIDKKFNFELVTDASKKRKISRKTGVSINVKHGTLSFPKHYVNDNKLHNEHIKLYVDIHNKVLGWKLNKESKEFLNLSSLKYYKRLKQNKTGAYIISIKTALNQFNFKDVNIKFTNLIVKQHKDMDNTFYKGIIYYVELINPIKLK